MRKVLLATTFVVAASIANAQATFGIHASGILASGTEKYKDANDSEENFTTDYKSRFSWKVGGVANIPVASAISFMPQLNILSKGGKIDEKESLGEDFSYEVEGKVKLTYVELPFNFVYNTSSFFVGAGPSLSFGIGGNMEGKSITNIMGDVQTDSHDMDVKFDGKKDAEDEKVHLKSMELGANFIAGYKLPNGLFIQANYNLGLSNIDPEEGYTSKNKYFGIGIGYFFGSKK